MLQQLPEEILDRIIFLALSHKVPSTSSPRPTWHTRPSLHLPILLTSHQFVRIATRHVYRTIHIATRTQARLLHRSLENNPSLAPHVCSLTMLGVWPEGGLIMGLCKGAVRYLDINLERFSEAGPEDREYAEGLRELVGVRHLTVRKPYHVYQSLPRLRYIVVALAKAIGGWTELGTANIAFKLSDDTPTSPVLSSTTVFSSFSLAYPSVHIPADNTPPTSQHTSIGPTTQLSTALAHAPNLHTFTTQLPSVWNVAILTISTNPSLQRIIFSDGSYESSFPDDPFHAYPLPPAEMFLPPWRAIPFSPSADQGSSMGVGGTGLFLMEARRHPRLSELIRAGTWMTRARTNAMGCPSLTSGGGQSEVGDRDAGHSTVTNSGVSAGGRARVGLGLNWG